jgi:hypothetical protein
LEELLKNEPAETEASLPNRYQEISSLSSSSPFFRQKPSHSKLESKTINLKLSVDARLINRSLNTSTTKELLKTRLSNQFPKIEKNLFREKMKMQGKTSSILVNNWPRSKFQNPLRQNGENYLEPVNY